MSPNCSPSVRQIVWGGFVLVLSPSVLHPHQFIRHFDLIARQFCGFNFHDSLQLACVGAGLVAFKQQFAKLLFA